MKCPSCGHNQKYADGMTCSSCRHRFVFDPKQDGYTDGKMMGLIRKASANDTYYFTFNQLYAEFCRRQLRFVGCGCVMAILASCLVAPIVYFNFDGEEAVFAASVFVAIGCLIGLITWSGSRKGPPRPQKFREFVDRWGKEGIKGSLDRLLENPRLHDPPPEWPEPDIYDYGVERVLVVEHDMLVDLLVLNGFHSENRVAVLSESGYPDYLVPLATKLLDDRPDLPVFLLHDASPRGAGMQQRLITSPMLPLHSHRIIDTGLFEEDISKLKGLRRFNAQKMASGVAVDMLLYATLAAGLSTALIEETTFAAMIAAGSSGSDTTTSFG